MGKPKGSCIWRPAVCVAAVGTLVSAGTALGGAILEFRPVFSSGAGNISGTTIELFEDDQFVVFELYARDWDNGPDSGFCIEQDGVNSGIPCPNGLADCGFPQTCGPAIFLYQIGLDCADWDNGSVPLETDTSGSECFFFDNSFCAGVDQSRADWAMAVTIGSPSGCNVVNGCPGGEFALPWDNCGAIVITGRGADSGNEGEVYLATYALFVPAGAEGVWTIGLDLGAPGFAFMVNTGSLNWIDAIVPMAIVLVDNPGRCCGHPGGALGCVDGILRSECLDAGGAAFTTNESCAGADDDDDGIDDACDNCDVANPNQADCDSNGTGDVCEIADCTGDPACSDCNNNGVPDGCDTTDCTGELLCVDCNSNGIPDTCEIAADPSIDCPDGIPNGIPDECEPDCQAAGEPGSGSADTCDLTNGTSVDTNANGVPDECDTGACCYFDDASGTFNCAVLTSKDCDDIFSGDFQGIDTPCPTEIMDTIMHNNVAVVHITETAPECNVEGGRRADCIPGDPIDPWQTPSDVVMGHQFGAGPKSPPIPAGFFAPGSALFTGTVFLKGEPLGPTELGEFGDADTLVRRTGGPLGNGDPFDRCDLPSAAEVQVSVEVVELSLVSTEPITVMVSGVPEDWDVAVDRSPLVDPPLGTITAIKTHCNGGTYSSALNVQPRFTFTRVSDGQVRVLDTGLEGIPHVTLTQDAGAPWIADVSESFPLSSNICTSFHPGIEDSSPTTDCDCNTNDVRDKCDIETGVASDCNENAVPDSCDIDAFTSPDDNGNGIPDECDAVAPLPENSLGVATCTDDSQCTNKAYCVPDASGGFPGICYVPKNRYLSVAPSPVNDVATARRLSVVTFARSCGGDGKTSCTSDTQCAEDPAGTTCVDVRVGSQVIGWFGTPGADGHAGVVDEADRHYAIWADLSFPIECGVDGMCRPNTHCDVGIGASNTCKWSNGTEVTTDTVQLTGCHISPKKRDVSPAVGEKKAANYYLIEAILEGSLITNPSNYSAPLELRTVVIWGDMTGGTSGNNVALPPEGSPGFLDILHQVKRFKDIGKATTAWLDLDPQVPDRGVGFVDMLQGVNGFKDQPYPFDDPCTCAGLPPCN